MSYGNTSTTYYRHLPPALRRLARQKLAEAGPQGITYRMVLQGKVRYSVHGTGKERRITGHTIMETNTSH